MLRGFVDHYNVAGHKISGWLVEGQGDGKCLVLALVNDEVVAESVAEGFREDLLQAGIGDGCYSFELLLPKDLPLGTMVKVVEKSTGELVAGGEIEVKQHKPSYDYHIDHVTVDGLCGWIIDRNDGDHNPIRLEFKSKSGDLRAFGETYIVRQDLDSRRCGFDLAFSVDLLEALPVALTLKANDEKVADCYILLPANAEAMVELIEEKMGALISAATSNFNREMDDLRTGFSSLISQIYETNDG